MRKLALTGALLCGMICATTNISQAGWGSSGSSGGSFGSRGSSGSSGGSSGLLRVFGGSSGGSSGSSGGSFGGSSGLFRGWGSSGSSGGSFGGSRGSSFGGSSSRGSGGSFGGSFGGTVALAEWGGAVAGGPVDNGWGPVAPGAIIGPHPSQPTAPVTPENEFLLPGGPPQPQFAVGTTTPVPFSAEPANAWRILVGEADYFEYLPHPDREHHPRATMLRVEAPLGARVFLDEYELRKNRDDVWRYIPKEPLVLHLPNVHTLRVEMVHEGQTLSRTVIFRLRPGKLLKMGFK